MAGHLRNVGAFPSSVVCSLSNSESWAMFSSMPIPIENFRFQQHDMHCSDAFIAPATTRTIISGLVLGDLNATCLVLSQQVLVRTS